VWGEPNVSLFRYGDALRVRVFTSGKFDSCDDLRVISLREDDARNNRIEQEMHILTRGKVFNVSTSRVKLVSDLKG